MKELPIGIQDYPTLVRRGCVYADKTPLIYQLVNGDLSYFFSRPRRFGKSLLASTLAAIFRGEKKLFSDTWIASSDYKWPVHPVLHLDLSLVASDSPEELRRSLNSQLAAHLGSTVEPDSQPSANLIRLIDQLARQGPVAILVDEYDAPLVDQLTNQEVLSGNRRELQAFFRALKALQSKLRFVFLTGVSRFSKVSLLSGLNSLTDISLDQRYATLAGLTEAEIREHFSEYLKLIAEKKGLSTHQILQELRHWYNGYSFAREANSTRVYNPWSVLNYLRNGELLNHWLSTATPTFAIRLMQEQNFPLIDFEKGIDVGDEIDLNHDSQQLPLVALLFQTGYLTIEAYDPIAKTYTLCPPNEEVRRSLIEHLFAQYISAKTWEARPILGNLIEALEAKDLDTFFKRFNKLLAAVPYQIQHPTEAYYHSLLYLCVRMLGFDVKAEVMTNRGRIDMALSLQNDLYIFEFKIDSSAKKALKQIKDSDYAAQFALDGKHIHLVGANFSTKTRAIEDWQMVKGHA